jgi:hypothetical protein
VVVVEENNRLVVENILEENRLEVNSKLVVENRQVHCKLELRNKIWGQRMSSPDLLRKIYSG